MELVLNKIDMEYEFYFMDMMKSTKENIFAKSKEIELKKAIVLFLKRNVHSNKEIKLIRMTTTNNLIDEFYRYVIDHEDIDREEAMNKYLMNYIENKGTMDPKALNQWKFVPEKWTVPAAERDYKFLFGDSQ